MLLRAIATVAAGGVAGGLGALLGVGGGVLLVPFLNLVLGLPMREAAAISLVTVIATSSVTSAPPGRLALVNLRLGMILEIFTTSGGLIGLLIFQRTSDRMLQGLFALVMMGVAFVMLRRAGVRNVIDDLGADVGSLGGRFHDADTGREMAYRLKRPIVAFGVSFLAGIVSMLGIGGGVLKVPVLNAWCGIPMRVAAATSALMIAATAVVGSINFYVRGEIHERLAAAAVLGVLAGSRIGFAIGARTTAGGLRKIMAIVLLTVAVSYFIGLGGAR